MFLTTPSSAVPKEGGQSSQWQGRKKPKNVVTEYSIIIQLLAQQEKNEQPYISLRLDRNNMAAITLGLLGDADYDDDMIRLLSSPSRILPHVEVCISCLKSAVSSSSYWTPSGVLAHQKEERGAEKKQLGFEEETQQRGERWKDQANAAGAPR